MLKLGVISIDEVKNAHREGNSKFDGFPLFNTCQHTVVKITDDMETITVKLMNGEFVTMCFMDKSKCIDIVYHGNGNHKVHSFFEGSSKTVKGGLYCLDYSDDGSVK